MIQNGPVRINISLPPMSAGELFARLGFSLEGLGPAWVAIISDLLRQLDATGYRWDISEISVEGQHLHIIAAPRPSRRPARDLPNLQGIAHALDLVAQAEIRSHLTCELCGALRTPCQPGDTLYSCTAGCGSDPCGHNGPMAGALRVSQEVWDAIMIENEGGPS